MDPTVWKWIGIVLLVAQSGTFSGLNLAMFGVTSLRLRMMANLGDEKAARLFAMRQDSNFLLTTILWGNVATNVLLAMLSDSVMAGVTAFIFSTFVITFGGEIIPQAYFSRHALRMASLLAPVLRIYQFILYPVAKPSALLLDWWLGKESVAYIPEEQLRESLRLHIQSPHSDIGPVEGKGAINFMDMDDLLVSQEGEPVDEESVLHFPLESGKLQFPAFNGTPDDAFLQRVQASGKHWVLLAPEGGEPRWAMDAPDFLRAALFGSEPANPLDYCHHPIIIRNRHTKLSHVLGSLETEPGDDTLDDDIILLWGEEKRIITGSDLLGYLLRGIVTQAH
jgi:metal transporter CNNM